MVADKAGIVVVQEAERAVVERHPQNGHVVAVHDAVGEAYRLPPGDQARRADGHVVVEPCVRVRTARRVRQVWITLRDHIVRQSLDVVELPPPIEIFEVAEPDVRRGQPQQHGAGFHMLAEDLFLAPHHTQGACRGNAQPMHRLAAEVLPDAGAQHRTAVIVTRERRQARTFEMQVPLLTPAVADLAQQDRAAVAEAGDIGAELMAGIDHCERLAARQQVLAPEAAGELRPLGLFRVQIDQGRGVRVETHQEWILERRRRHLRGEDLGQARKGVVEVEGLERAPCGHGVIIARIARGGLPPTAADCQEQPDGLRIGSRSRSYACPRPGCSNHTPRRRRSAGTGSRHETRAMGRTRWRPCR